MDAKTSGTNGTSSLFSTNIFGSTPPTQDATPVAQTTATAAPVLTKAEQDIYDSLNPQEKAELATVIRGMDVTQPNFTSEYGKDARMGIVDVNEEALSVTRTKDLGKVGTSMSNLMLQLKGISVPSQTRGIFKRTQSYIAQLNAKLAPAEKNVEKAVAIMDAHKGQLAADNVSFDSLYKKNLAYYRALTLYIIAGKMKLDEERKTTLVTLQKRATETGDMADVEAYNSYNSQLNQFDSLLNEFESSRLLCLQTAPVIRMAQENNKLLIQKFDYIFTTAVPAWRTQIHLALNLENSKQAASAANAAIDFTNDLIRQNADMLKQGTIDIARLSEREIIESDTLEYANQRLIEGIEAVFQIHAEGKAQREANREKRAMLEEDLKNELLQLTARQ